MHATPQSWCGRWSAYPDNGGYSQNGTGHGLRGTFVHRCVLVVWLVVYDREKLIFEELALLLLLEYA